MPCVVALHLSLALNPLDDIKLLSKIKTDIIYREQISQFFVKEKKRIIDYTLLADLIHDQALFNN